MVYGISTMRKLVYLAALFNLLLINSVYAEVKVNVQGCVASENTIEYSTKVTLFQVLQDARLTKCAYLYGSSWLLESKYSQQRSFKKQLLSDISHLLNHVQSQSEYDYLMNLQHIVLNQEVTGRVSPTDFDLFHVEMLALKNRVVVDDSTFVFPSRSSSIYMIGMNKAKLAYDSNMSISDINSKVGVCESCQAGWLWLVQPNGGVEKRKVGYWTHEEFYIAPGGWLVSELSSMDVNEFIPGFYEKLATWLATQVVR